MKTFTSFGEVMDFAVNREAEAVDFYRMLADFVEKPEMAEVLSGLASQESDHKAKLAAIKAERIVVDEKEVGDLGRGDVGQDRAYFDGRNGDRFEGRDCPAGR